MIDRLKLKYCAGRRDNYYNQGAERCWSFDTATTVWRKEVPMDQRPPWTQEAKRVLSCYRRPGYVYVDPKRTR